MFEINTNFNKNLCCIELSSFVRLQKYLKLDDSLKEGKTTKQNTQFIK